MSKPKTNRLNRALKPLCKSLKKPSFWLRLFRDLTVLLLIGFAIASYQQRHMLKGKAPALDGTTIQGAIFQGATFQGAIFKDTIIQAKNVFSKQNSEKEPSAKLVYFFGTWCPICRFTSPAVDAISQDYPSLAIALSSGTDQQLKGFMAQEDYQFEVINDDNGELSKAWGVQAVPAFYILDSQNNIVFVTSGASSQWGLRLRLWWASL
jgi:thiol-disulfide isomerase/thioredoxin